MSALLACVITVAAVFVIALSFVVIRGLSLPLPINVVAGLFAGLSFSAAIYAYVEYRDGRIKDRATAQALSVALLTDKTMKMPSNVRQARIYDVNGRQVSEVILDIKRGQDITGHATYIDGTPTACITRADCVAPEVEIVRAK